MNVKLLEVGILISPGLVLGESIDLIHVWCWKNIDLIHGFASISLLCLVLEILILSVSGFWKY